jgi:uncharacterized Ntn-hydrolase superfamily protein
MMLRELVLISLCLCGQEPVSTFSIVARDAETGEMGVAVASRFLAVGSVVPWAAAGNGAVATQAWANPAFGPGGLALLELGLPAEEVVGALVRSDEARERRQVGIVDRGGGVAAWTGSKCLTWAGDLQGEEWTAQGNILAGPEVLEAMGKAFDAARGELAERLMESLAAGEAAGGDRRGRQSAAILVVREGAGYGGTDRYVDLRVDDHRDPVKELRRLLGLQLAMQRVLRAFALREQGRIDEGARLLEEAIALDPTTGANYYNAACFHALAGEAEEALELLGEAFKKDPRLRELAAEDEDLDSLRESRRFRRLMRRKRR